MMRIDDDLTDELDVVTDALAPTKKARDEAARAPQGFNPAAMFLLRLAFDNLFEPANAAPGAGMMTYRCKGCSDVVRRGDRETHFRGHQRQAARRELAKQTKPLYRDTNDNGRDDRPAATPHEGDATMATTKTESKKSTPKAEPRVLKTKVAREAAIDVLTKAGKALTMDEIVTAVMKRAAVTNAGVPKGTVSAQINFELLEKEPRIYRVTRGVYAAKGVKADPPAAPAAKTEAAKTEAKPDPKPSSRKRTAKPKAEPKTEDEPTAETSTEIAVVTGVESTEAPVA